MCYEDWTSQTCRKSGDKGKRPTQGLFLCDKCGEENADRNAAFNIGYRALGYISKVGATVNSPITLPSVVRNTMVRISTNLSIVMRKLSSLCRLSSSVTNAPYNTLNEYVCYLKYNHNLSPLSLKQKG